MKQLYLCTCDFIRLFYIWLPGSHINTL